MRWSCQKFFQNGWFVCNQRKQKEYRQNPSVKKKKKKKLLTRRNIYLLRTAMSYKQCNEKELKTGILLHLMGTKYS